MKISVTRLVGVGAFLVVAFLSTADARESSLVGESNASIPGTWSSITDKMYLAYWGLYAGPSISSPSGYTTTPNAGLGTKPQYLESLITVGYRTSADTVVGFGLPFNLLPFANAGGQIKPPFLRIMDTRIIDAAGFRMSGDVRIYTPIGDIASRIDEQTGLRLSQLTTYQVANSRFLIGEQAWIRGWVFGPNGSGNRNDLEITFSPFANYRISPTFAATLWTDVLQLGHAVGAPFGFSNTLVDVQPGVLWDITPKININPYVNIFPGNLSFDTTTLGALLNVKVL